MSLLLMMKLMKREKKTDWVVSLVSKSIYYNPLSLNFHHLLKTLGMADYTCHPNALGDGHRMTIGAFWLLAQLHVQ